MSFILRWLGLGKPTATIGLRPHRDVELNVGFDAAYARALSGIELALGANVTLDDRSGGLIEAAFGLVNNERVRCTMQRIDDAHTRIRIEAIFPAGAQVQGRSRAVDALADAILSP